MKKNWLTPQTAFESDRPGNPVRSRRPNSSAHPAKVPPECRNQEASPEEPQHTEHHCQDTTVQGRRNKGSGNNLGAFEKARWEFEEMDNEDQEAEATEESWGWGELRLNREHELAVRGYEE